MELQKQIAEERYTINGIIARMSAESAEYEKSKRIFELKKAQVIYRIRIPSKKSP